MKDYSQSETCMRRKIRPRQFHRVLSCVFVLAFAVSGARAAEEAGKSNLPSSLGYKSPLADYRKFVEQPVGSWREANDNVGRIGGWRAYASESQEGIPARETPKEGDEHAAHHQEPSK